MIANQVEHVQMSQFWCLWYSLTNRSVFVKSICRIELAAALHYIGQTCKGSCSPDKLLDALEEEPCLVAPIIRHAGSIEDGEQESIVGGQTVPSRIATSTQTSVEVHLHSDIQL